MYRLFYIIICFTTICSAQTSQDTIFIDNQYFIKHLVKYNHTLEYISGLYNVTQKDIIIHNDITNRRLYYKQLLYIPINISQKDIINNPLKESVSNLSLLKEKEDKTIQKKSMYMYQEHGDPKRKVALLLPFYIEQNDTLFRLSKNLNNNINNIVYNKSNLALSFFQGVKLALDSLKKIGKDISLHVFDTGNDSIKVQRLVDSGNLDSMDLIIGPIFSRNLAVIANKYGRDDTKKIISPLSRVSTILRENPSVYQLNSSLKIQGKYIRDFLLKRYHSKNVYIFYQLKEKGYASYVHQLFKRKKKATYFKHIEYTHIDSLRQFIRKDQCIIIPSYDQIFVSKLLGSLGGIDSSFVVFGLNNWKNFENLDIYNLMDLNVHISDPYYSYGEGIFDKRFLYLFENKYKASSNRFSYVGYQTMLHFCSNVKIYKFQKNKYNDGHINMKSPIFYYKDFQLKQINM